MKQSFHILAHYFKHSSLLLAAPAILLLTQGQAKAILNIRIFDDGPDLKITVDGALSQLSTPTSTATEQCGFDGGIVGEFSGSVAASALCTGSNQFLDVYSISTTPSGFGGTPILYPASSVTGPGFWFAGLAYNGNPRLQASIGMPAGYTAGTTLLSSATFNGTSLAAEGFTTTGLVGTWTLVGTTESINVYIGPSSVPGPLPLLGASAAFGWSRRLRRRIASPGLTPSKA
jgi:hypothetical protein